MPIHTESLFDLAKSLRSLAETAMDEDSRNTLLQSADDFERRAKLRRDTLTKVRAGHSPC
jgi:hypothetical protein